MNEQEINKYKRFLNEWIDNTYERLLNEWIENNNVRVGDKVKVTRKPKSWELLNERWIALMDNSIGMTFKIRTLGDGEVRLEGSPCVFPYYVLEIVGRRGPIRIEELRGKVVSYVYCGSIRKFTFIRMPKVEEDGTFLYICLEEKYWVSLERVYRGDEEVPKYIGIYRLIE